MRSFQILSLSVVLLLVAACDSASVEAPPDEPQVPLLPLHEGNSWTLQRTNAAGQQFSDTLYVSSSFSHSDETWTHVAANGSPILTASGYFVVREDGYYKSGGHPSESTFWPHLKYAYPAVAGMTYTIEPAPWVVSGAVAVGSGVTNVTVVSTDEKVLTPFGERTAYRYRFSLEEYYVYGEPYQAIDLYYDRVLVPDLGFVELETAWVTVDVDEGTASALAITSWKLMDADINP